MTIKIIIQICLLYLCTVLTGCTTYDQIYNDVYDYIYGGKEQEAQNEQFLKEKALDESYIKEETIDESFIQEQNIEQNIEDENEGSINKETIDRLESYLSGRFKEYGYEFSSKLGITVKQTGNNKVIFEKNSDKCLIPSSLINIIICSALIEMLEKNSRTNVEHTFITKVDQLNIKSLKGMSLDNLFKKLNIYTFSEITMANNTAQDTCDFLTQMAGTKKNKKNKINTILSDHIKRISKYNKCNKFHKPSGLSLYNKFTADQIADCLFYLKKSKLYIQTLQRGGQGTLKNRLLDIGNKHLFKAGYMRKNGVMCLAGLLNPYNGVHFAILINNIKTKEYDKNIQWIDDMVRGICAILGVYTPKYTTLL